MPTDSLVILYKGYFECIVNLRPTMQIVNSIHTNIFGGLARQLKLYIKQKALTDDCENEVIINLLCEIVKHFSDFFFNSNYYVYRKMLKILVQTMKK